MHRIVSDYTKVDDGGNSNIQVFVRARPLETDTEQADFIATDPEDVRRLIIKDPDASNKRYGEVAFQFDKVFWTSTKQEEVFDTSCKTQVNHVLNGYNSCCFAYGQTGSGKTYTMFGEGGEIRGIIPRSVEYLFKSLAQKTNTSEVAMVCSFLEIYNDQIRDLGKAYLAAMGVEDNNSSALHEKTSDLFERLAGYRGNNYFAPAFHKAGSAMAMSGAARPGLKEVQDEYNTMNYEIREDNEGNVFVKDLSLVPVTTMEEVMSLISTGLRVRATHETKMNAVSSRSHTVFTITVLQRDKVTGEAITGMLNLVDLAGSERLKKSESVGVRLKEALHINTSLTALGKVIMALDPSSEQTHIPYRDSKLTRVLQNSLGGNSFTTVFATVHPSSKYYEECLSSLQFANRCRNVRNNPRVNYVEDSEDKDRKIRKLMDEIGVMRTKMSQMGPDGTGRAGEPGGIGGMGGGGGKMNMQAIVGVLKRLGISASTSADGALVVNGQKFAADDIGLGEGSTSSGEGGGGPMTGGMCSSKEVGGASAVQVEKLNRQIKELKEANANYAAKAKERKIQLEEHGRQLHKMSTDLVKLQTGMRHKEFECKTLAEDKDRSLHELRHFLESKYAVDLQSMINHNKDMMTHYQADFEKIPAALLEYTKVAAKTMKERVEAEKPLQIQFDAQLVELEKSRLAELAHVRKQYDFWLEEKDKALSGFVDAFNAYRAKKSEQLRMAEREIVKLYEAYEQLDDLLDAARKGKYPIRFKDGAIPVYRGGGGTQDHHSNTTGPGQRSRPRTATGVVGRAGSTSADGGGGGGGGGGGAGGGTGTGTGTVSANEEADDVLSQVMATVAEGGVGAVVRGGGVVIGKEEIPENPVTCFGPSPLPLTRNVVEKHKERELRMKRMKADAFRKSLHYVEKSVQQSQKSKGIMVDPSLKLNVRDFLKSQQQQAGGGGGGGQPATPTGASASAKVKGSSDNFFLTQQQQQRQQEGGRPPRPVSAAARYNNNNNNNNNNNSSSGGAGTAAGGGGTQAASRAAKPDLIGPPPIHSPAENSSSGSQKSLSTRQRIARQNSDNALATLQQQRMGDDPSNDFNMMNNNNAGGSGANAARNVMLANTHNQGSMKSLGSRGGGGGGSGANSPNGRLQQRSATAPPGLEGRSLVDSSMWDEQDALPETTPTRNGRKASSPHALSYEQLTADSAAAAELNESLSRANVALLAEIREMKVREGAAKELADKLASNETIQYIGQMEGEVERLKKLVKDINAQLHSAKVANKALTRKFGPHYISGQEKTFGAI